MSTSPGPILPNGISADLLAISHLYGGNKDFIIAGGGNSSYKTSTTMWIKASGFELSRITASGFVAVDRQKLRHVLEGRYSADPFQREAEIKERLLDCRLDRELGGRPSVETNMHEMIDYAYVVHTHPYVINAVLCNERSRAVATEIMGDDAMYVEYTDPGYTLAKRVEQGLQLHRANKGKEPHVICLENHGIIVSADSTAEIVAIYDALIARIQRLFTRAMRVDELSVPPEFSRAKQAMARVVGPATKVILARNDTLIEHFTKNQTNFQVVQAPFTPDIVVYCKGAPLFIPAPATDPDFEQVVDAKLHEYQSKWTYPPKIIIVRELGMIAVDENEKSATNALDMFEDSLKIGFYAGNFGTPHPLTPSEIQFIDTWEVENYRRQMAKQQH